jgi:rhodanese-related sulfurtransferase
MATYATTTGQAARISPRELKSRMDAGEPATILDVRNPKAWDSSDVKIRGAVRVSPDQPMVDSPWPKDWLTVVYCT